MKNDLGVEWGRGEPGRPSFFVVDQPRFVKLVRPALFKNLRMGPLSPRGKVSLLLR
jgi:hypothetical protein